MVVVITGMVVPSRDRRTITTTAWIIHRKATESSEECSEVIERATGEPHSDWIRKRRRS
jgi:hypothetical protein